MNSSINFSNLDEKKLAPIIQEIVLNRCERLGIFVEELFNSDFNTDWIVKWVQKKMPLEKTSDDYHYQVIMYDCREQILKKLRILNLKH